MPTTQKETVGFLNGRVNIKEKDLRQPRCAQRWIIAYMGMWMGMSKYVMSSNMSVAIVCMVNSPPPTAHQNLSGNFINTNDTYVNSRYSINTKDISSELQDRPDEFIFNRSHPGFNLNVFNHLINVTNEDRLPRRSSCELVEETGDSLVGEFDWDRTTQSMILSAYFYGYMVSQLIGGWLAGRFGGKVTIGICMALNAAFTLFTPVLARWHPYALVTTRVIMGVSSGIGMPGVMEIVGKWALPCERNRFVGLVWFGEIVGAIVSFVSSGFLCKYGFDNGWPSIFYAGGTFSSLFVICWVLLVFNNPQSHPRITDAEKTLLERNIKMDTDAKKKMASIPWRKMLLYSPFYAMVVANICDAWTYYLLFTCLPLYLNEVLHFNITSNGLFSSLPMVSMLAGVVVASVMSDFVRSKHIFTVTTIRKAFQITGFVGIAVFIVVPGYLNCESRAVVIVCICLCTFLEALGFVAGYSCNAVDISPQYSSIMFAISNTVASIPGVVVPVVVAQLTANKTSEEWRVVLFIAAGVALFGAMIYGIFASSELAPWSGGDNSVEIELEKPLSGHEKQDVDVNELGKRAMAIDM